MANREQAQVFKLVTARNSATISSNTTTVGVEVDTQGFGAVTLAIQSATITDGVYTPLIEETDTTGTGYTTVAALDLTVTPASIAFIATDDNVVKKIGYTGSKRFIRLSLVSTGVTTGGAIGALAILGEPSHAPVA